MTSDVDERRARTGLALVADAVPTYAVLPGAVRQAHRRRRLRRIGAAAIVLVVVLGTAAGMAGVQDVNRVSPAAPTPAGPALPTRLGRPLPWEPTVRASPPGTAVAAFSGEGSGYVGDWFSWTTHVVGARTGVFRDAGTLTFPGQDAFLSPDGNLLAATEYGGGLTVVDLRTARARRMVPPDPVPNESYQPLAWAPDGRSFVVLRSRGQATTEAAGGYYARYEADLAVVDQPTGRYRLLDRIDRRAVAGVGDATSILGIRAAFSPDGRTVVYGVGRELRVRALDGPGVTFPLPVGAQLAGTGAVAPDGRGVALVTRSRCCSDVPARFDLSVLDPITGRVSAAPAYPSVDGADLRVVAWRGRTAVAVLSEGVVREERPRDPGGPAVSRMAVVTLRSGASRPDVVLRTVTGVEALDVPAQVAARSASAPAAEPSWYPVAWRWAVAAGLAALSLSGVVALVVVLVWSARRRRPLPRRRPRSSATS